MASPDLISVVETAYRLELNDEAWLRSLLEQCHAHLDAGLGVIGYTFQLVDGALQVDATEELGTRNGAAEIYSRSVMLAPLTIISRSHFEAPGLATFRGVYADMPEALERFESGLAPALGMQDLLGLNALDPTRRGVAFATLLPSPHDPDAAAVQRWSRVAAHIAAGSRLRRALHGSGSASGLPLGAEAVMSPDGSLVHAESAAQSPDAREALREAARRADRARGKLRRHDAEEALELWQGLVDGRWSLIDWSDSDGRRFLVARKNDPEAPDPRALTQRERQIVGFAGLGHGSKLIAYELGLSESTINTHLHNAFRKLGLAGRAQLIAFMQQLMLAPATRSQSADAK